MCAKREPQEIYRPIATLDAELGDKIYDLVMGGEDRLTSGCWTGGYAYYAMTEGV